MARTHKIIIDLGSIDSKQDLHEALSAALTFPGWYGCNWDAFRDAITGLVEMPEKLHFPGWTAFEARMPDEARHLHAALTEMSEKYPESASEVSYG
ncbi:MAG: barstar family protein [Lysobacteraceae bacterium]